MAFTLLNPDAPQADANAYISVAEFTVHHTDRGVASVVDGEFEPSDIQAAIIRATDYIDKRFGRKFRGYKRSAHQRLEWPRIDAIDNDGYLLDSRPRQLVDATCEYALLSLQLKRNLAPVPATPFPTIDPVTGVASAEAGGVVKAQTKIVGPIESTVEYQTAPMLPSQMSMPLPAYPQADLWLQELINSSSSRRLVRG